jgi:site-specific DNA-methyltransferase (adenine-specific)
MQVWFDPQHRSVLDKQKYGNEGEWQRERFALLAMSDDYIKTCLIEISRILSPSSYCLLWADKYRLGTGDHLHVAEHLKLVDIISWDSQRMGMGYRSRYCGDFLLVLQKPPIIAKNWRDHSIRSIWPERVDRRVHPHCKPFELTRRIIAATTAPGNLICDPAAGSFVVMHAARALGREFIGCDLAEPSTPGGVSILGLQTH